MEPARRSRFALALVLVALGFGVVVVRVLADARAELRAGGDAERGGHLRLALAHYESAARAYLPGNPYANAAFARLLEIGVTAEKTADPEGARRAFESLRAAALGTRSFYLPHAEEVALVERRLAELYADWDLRSGRVTSAGAAGGVGNAADVVHLRASSVMEHARLLARRPGPNPGAALAACLGFCVWVGAAAVFFWRGLGPTLRPRRPAALASAVAFVVGFAVFVIALRRG